MTTITVPDELNSDNALPIEVIDYEIDQGIIKQEVILNKNTFSFLQRGTKEVFFDNSTCAIDKSKFLLMKSGHCLMTETCSDAQKSYRSVLLFFSNEAINDFIKKYDLKPSSSSSSNSTRSFEYDAFIERFVESILDISRFSKSTQRNILSAKFEEIMLYLIEFKGVDFLNSLISDEPDHDQKFRQTIESNKLNRLTVKELAFLANMSVSTFKREFEKQFHISPSKWFQNKRLEHAAYLLTHGKRPSEIYEEVGYETLSNFIVAFKLKHGLTPKQYQTG
ncbi:helix-turn-helix domain-containing protein [Aureibacter tunicatorum]|uniref:AraC-like DNA-binding protein n=1 Tax=Aureibacter tunicatorum TaxID=866807 RepID=A0AAE3XQ83_9BACT|nr:AraC family transcriptional regulator [Aureibacter tunicatorum]MDR6240620.1 AraC-like DNA-binding protein [Aureibacter tunicatorum]BDD06519.1 AraC family transcriptional regulator [Aureibacter tunicatorum]